MRKVRKQCQREHHFFFLDNFRKFFSFSIRNVKEKKNGNEQSGGEVFFFKSFIILQFQRDQKQIKTPHSSFFFFDPKTSLYCFVGFKKWKTKWSSFLRFWKKFIFLCNVQKKKSSWKLVFFFLDPTGGETHLEISSLNFHLMDFRKTL